jgi:hypothetical protein
MCNRVRLNSGHRGVTPPRTQKSSFHSSGAAFSLGGWCLCIPLRIVCRCCCSAVDALRQADFRNTDISVMFPDNAGTKDFAHEKNTKAPEGAATGAGSGAVIGGTLGWLAGIGALAIPGVGPFIAAGPIVAALAGVAVGGAVGGITGALVGMGIPEYQAKRYEGRVKEGSILLSVHCDDSKWTKKAKEILERTGAEDVSSTGESSADFSETDRPMERAS